MGDVEVEYRQGLFPVGRKPLHNRVRDRLLGEEVDGADFQPRVDHLCRADVLHAQRTVRLPSLLVRLPDAGKRGTHLPVDRAALRDVVGERRGGDLLDVAFGNVRGVGLGRPGLERPLRQAGKASNRKKHCARNQSKRFQHDVGSLCLAWLDFCRLCTVYVARQRRSSKRFAVGRKGARPSFRTKVVRANQADWPETGPVPCHPVNGCPSDPIVTPPRRCRRRDRRMASSSASPSQSESSSASASSSSDSTPSSLSPAASSDDSSERFHPVSVFAVRRPFCGAAAAGFSRVSASLRCTARRRR